MVKKKMTDKNVEIKQACVRCHIPRSFYDLKIEPSLYVPDYSMPSSCQDGHLWIVLIGDENINERNPWDGFWEPIIERTYQIMKNYGMIKDEKTKTDN